ncbi:GAF domain-containing protein [Desertihabitans brevis]|uniref:GAF domain-containing protein n=1 Tax=Desertihabitans brevis TaxID=2268447 RepID=A0A367YZ29_9ACTN|nr:GAF domain-containing protein [Desertihabitans brevis]RCK71173.1 GAF domain-containing protein [Desertihabitans brevis]
MDRVAPLSASIPPDRLAQLLEAQRALVQDLSLADVLARVVRVARKVSGARYAALGILAADGTLDEFVHVGVDEEQVTAIGQHPRGRGLLGALVDDPRPVRLERLSEHPLSSGFPPGHPPMTSFLGVPVRARSGVVGNLYLADRAGGPFTTDDEAVVTALAETAGNAVDNARLYDRAQRQQDWLRASADINRLLVTLAEDELTVLQRLSDTVLQLAGADVVSVVRPLDAEQLEVVVATGAEAHRVRGLRYPRAGAVAQHVMTEGRGMLLRHLDTAPNPPWLHLRAALSEVTSAMVVPLQGGGSRGAIVAARMADRPPFDQDLMEMAENFADQAALTLELAAARAARYRLEVLDERDRIARDLHDHTIQRLFAAGLRLQSVVASSEDRAAAGRVAGVVKDLDDTIEQIRSTIVALGEVIPAGTVADLVRRTVASAAAGLPVPPETTTGGPLETLDRRLLGDLTAVLREAVSNCVRHAGATCVRVRVDADAGRLTVTVSDDGRGFGASDRRSGLANLEHRAIRHGGTLTLSTGPGGGASLRWSIPQRPDGPG